MMAKMLTVMWDVTRLTKAEIEDIERQVLDVKPGPMKFNVLDTETLDAKVAGIMRKRRNEGQ